MAPIAMQNSKSQILGSRTMHLRNSIIESL